MRVQRKGRSTGTRSTQRVWVLAQARALDGAARKAKLLSRRLCAQAQRGQRSRMPSSWQRKLSASSTESVGLLPLQSGAEGSELDEPPKEQELQEEAEPQAEPQRCYFSHATEQARLQHPSGEVEVAAEVRAGSNGQLEGRFHDGWRSTGTSASLAPSCSGPPVFVDWQEPRKPQQKQPRESLEAEVPAVEQEEPSKRAKPRRQPGEWRRGGWFFEQQASRAGGGR